MKVYFENKHENGIIWKFDKQNRTTSCVFSNNDFSQRFYNFSRICFNATSQIMYSLCTILNKNIRKNTLNDAEIIFIDYKEKGYYILKEYSALSNIIFSKYCYSIFCINNT